MDSTNRPTPTLSNVLRMVLHRLALRFAEKTNPATALEPTANIVIQPDALKPDQTDLAPNTSPTFMPALNRRLDA